MNNEWANLTEAQRALLRRLIRREEYPEFEIISRDGIHDNTVKALQARGLIADSYVLRLTDLGRAVYEASQPTADAGAADAAGDLWQRISDYKDPAQQRWLDLQAATDELATLRTQLAAVTADNAALAAAIHLAMDKLQAVGNGMDGRSAYFTDFLDAFDILRAALRAAAALDSAKGESDGR